MKKSKKDKITSYLELISGVQHPGGFDFTAW